MLPKSNRATRWVFVIHRWTGLITGLNLLILSLTAVYLLGERIVLSDGSDAVGAAPQVDEDRRVPMQPIVDALLARYADEDIHLFAVGRALVESDDNSLGFAWKDDFFTFQVDVYTGELTQDYGDPPPGTLSNGGPGGLVFREGRAPDPVVGYSAFGEWMLELHANLFLGSVGTFLVGVIGVLFLVSMLTGLYVYAPFMKALAFGAIRRRRVRFLLADAHKLVGISSLAFNAIIALTGIGITLGFFGIQYYLLHQLKGFESAFGTITVADPLPSFEALHAAGQTVVPEEHIYHIRYPGGIQGDETCIIFARPNPWKEPLVPTYAVVTAEAEPRPMHAVTPLWIKAILIGAPIHYGEFGGRVMRIVYLLFALTSGGLSVSGYVIWYAKGRAKKRARASANPQPDETTGLAVNAPSEAGP